MFFFFNLQVFKFLASKYADAHETMSFESSRCGPSRSYSQKGTVNGAEWFSVSGSGFSSSPRPPEGAAGAGNSHFCLMVFLTGMQDFNYLHTNCFEVTVELGCDKFPPEEDLLLAWNENQEALLAFMEEVSLSAHSARSGDAVAELLKHPVRAQAHRGIKGIVKDVEGNGIQGAQISVRGVQHNITSGETSQPNRSRLSEC